MKYTAIIMAIGLLVCGVLLPIGFIVSIIATGQIRTIGGILVTLGLAYMAYDCGKALLRKKS